MVPIVILLESDSEIALSCSAVLQCRIPGVRDLLKLENSRPSRTEILGLSSNQENDSKAVRGRRGGGL